MNFQTINARAWAQALDATLGPEGRMLIENLAEELGRAEAAGYEAAVRDGLAQTVVNVMPPYEGDRGDENDYVNRVPGETQFRREEPQPLTAGERQYFAYHSVLPPMQEQRDAVTKVPEVNLRSIPLWSAIVDLLDEIDCGGLDGLTTEEVADNFMAEWLGRISNNS